MCNRTCRMLACLLAVYVLGAARADVVFNTFSSDNSFRLTNPLTLEPGATATAAAALRFQSPQTAKLLRVTIAAQGLVGGGVLLSLHPDVADRPGATPVQTWLLATPSAAVHTVTFAPDSAPTVTANVKYWLSVTYSGIGSASWFYPTQPVNGIRSLQRNGLWSLGESNTAPAIRIETNPGCPPGWFSSTGYAPCSQCPPGTYSDTHGATTCQNCPAGKYQSTHGSSECLSCPPGTFSASTGAVACQSCPAGFAQAEAGSAACKSCPPMWYSPTPGLANCLACTGSFTTFTSGSTECIDCPQGVACTTGVCQIGFYRPSEGDNCRSCTNTTLTIMDQPLNVRAIIGSSAAFSVTVGPNQGPLAYYWIKDGVPVQPSQNVSGERSYTLQFDPVTEAHVGTYAVVVSNSCLFTISNTVSFSLGECLADVNNSGSLSAQDIFDYLAAYFAHDLSADFNESGHLSAQDIFEFLAAYFAGC